MRRQRRRPMMALGLLSTAMVAGLGGCGQSGTTSSTAEATVKGTVTIRGKLADEGTVTFDPSNAKRKMAPAKSAPINKDGTYSIQTLVGGNNIDVGIPKLAGDRAFILDNTVSFDVQPGENRFDIVLPPPH